MFRFSLRTLLIATTVLAVVCAIPLRRAVLQKHGREWVATQRGHLTFAHKYDDETGTYDHSRERRVPGWLIGLLGVDVFDSVDSVTLDNQTVKDLRPLTDLQRLRTLAICIDVDRNLDFTPLGELPRLEKLHLQYTGISAERLAELREMLPHVRITSPDHESPALAK